MDAVLRPTAKKLHITVRDLHRGSGLKTSWLPQPAQAVPFALRITANILLGIAVAALRAVRAAFLEEYSRVHKKSRRKDERRI